MQHHAARLAICIFIGSGPLLAATPTFTSDIIDSGMSGDVKIVADIDNDGFKDLIAGGSPGEDLHWYHYPTWTDTQVALASVEFTTDGDAGDVDGDGDIDLVVPDGQTGNNLAWFENPRLTPTGNGDPFDGSQWRKRSIGATGSWTKDVELADFDGNGLLDIATRIDSQAFFFFQTSPNTWSKVTFTPANLGIEGMASGDIDNDGDVDLVVQGAWLRNPGGPNARTPASWTPFVIGAAPSEFKAVVANMDADAAKEILFSSSEGVADVTLWNASSPTGSWTSQVVASSIERAHTLQTADMDRDGDVDVVVGQMHTSSSRILAVYLNSGAATPTWTRFIVNQGNGLHNGVVADIGNDGDYDIYGSNWTTNLPLRLYANTTTVGADAWSYVRLSSTHTQTMGLAFADIDRDGRKDVVSGQFWYRNPGGDLTGAWTRSAAFPNTLHAILSLDVDGDSFSDVIAQKTEGSALAIYWLEATNSSGTAWNSINVGSVPAASHTLGAQGYRVANIRSGGRSEVLVSSGGGIWYFEIPANPATDPWSARRINANPSDEGFDVADIDRDGLLDVVAGTGDSKRVEWYKNPGTTASDWSAVVLGNMNEVVFPDRFAAADLNRDGRLDVIGTEENGTTSGARTFWWEQPATATAPNWVRRTLATQGSTNSMDVADMDADGDSDVVLAEHRGGLKIAVWRNDGAGTFTERSVGSGNESHLGARVVDLDGDGDQDLVSIAWDAPQFIHLWRNDAIVGGTPADTTPPTMSGAASSNVTTSGATITWSSNEPASSRVEYGATTSYGSTSPTNTTLVTSHTRTLTGLAAGTTYHYRVRSADAAGNEAIGGDMTFTTTATTPPPNEPPPPPPPSGTLIGHWKLDEGSGTAVADASGNGRNGNLLNGTTWTTGRLNGAVSLDGSNDYISLPSIDVTGSAITIAAWVKFKSFPSGTDQRIVSKANSSAEAGHWWMLGQINNGANRLRFRLKAGGVTSTLIATSGNLSAEVWYHAAAVYDGSSMKLYLNGVQVGSLSKSGSLNTSSSVAVNIGRNPDAYGLFSGAVDDVRIYSRALTATEISSVMNGGTP
jgi:hypothetical protein